MLDAVIYSSEKLLFQGKAGRMIFPGENGIFEVLSYHKPVLSRLVKGKIIVDAAEFPIRAGIVGVMGNKATVVVEE